MAPAIIVAQLVSDGFSGPIIPHNSRGGFSRPGAIPSDTRALCHLRMDHAEKMLVIALKRVIPQVYGIHGVHRRIPRRLRHLRIPMSHIKWMIEVTDRIGHQERMHV